MSDNQKTAEAILHGTFPDGQIAPDDYVAIINSCVDIISMSPLNREHPNDGANNLILWLGGLSQDLRCYGIQLILYYHKLAFCPDEKAQERIDTVVDNAKKAKPYRAETFDQMVSYHWPKVFSNTLEERLEALADEVAELDTDDVPSVDMILTGQASPSDLDVDNMIRLVQDCLEDLKAVLTRYGNKPNIVYYERLNHFMEWLTEIDQIEIPMLAMRSALKDYQLPIKKQSNLPAWKNLDKRLTPYIVF